MKVEKRIVKTLAAFAVICGLSLSAHAQIGSGWTSDGETYTPQTSSGCTITSISGGFEFSVPSGQGRAEQRGNNLPTTTTNQWQGFATLKSFPSGSDKICVHQVFGPAPSTPDLILDEATYSGGIELMSLEQGDAFEANIQVGVQFQLNTIYDPVGNLITIYVNGSQTGTKTPNSGVHYNKYGQYVSESGTGPATMDWVNVQSWAGGTAGGGGGGTTVATPTFSPGGGTYTSTQSVSISDSTSGATIYYTTNGSTPTTSSTVYSGAISVSSTTTIKAIGAKSGDTTSSVASATYTISVSEGPFGGTPAAIPGTVQAENYDTGGQGVAYNVTSINGTDNGYRSDGVDLDVTSDTGGGVDLGWESPGQWFKYTVNVATAGTYTVSFRIAAPGAVTDAFHLSNSSGTNLSGNVNLPATGGYQTWATVTASVTLPAGQQILTLNEDNGGGVWNINYMSFALNASNRTLTGSSGDGWHALAISPGATGTFTATYDATPSVSPENAVVGLSSGAATGFDNLGCIARFNPSGQIDAYNGTAYAAASSINYSAGVSYHFEMDVNLTAHTYSVYVTPSGGAKTLVGSNYAFRSTANTMTSLTDWNLDVDPSIGGASLTANNLTP